MLLHATVLRLCMCTDYRGFVAALSKLSESTGIDAACYSEQVSTVCRTTTVVLWRTCYI
jgi:hypothetical protein